MKCQCKCHFDGMNNCAECLKYHTLEEQHRQSPGFLIDQTLEGFFMDKLTGTEIIKNLIFIFSKATLTISWDDKKNTFKFTVQPK